MDINSIFAERFKNLRLSKGYNQDFVADKLNLNRSTITNYERGYIMPTSAKLPEIAKFFNVSVGYLLGETDFLTERDAIYNFEKMKKSGYIMHDLQRIFEDLKEQIALDEELTYKNELITDSQKDLIINQIDNILKIISI